MDEGVVSLLGPAGLTQKEARAHLRLTLDLVVFHRTSDGSNYLQRNALRALDHRDQV